MFIEGETRSSQVFSTTGDATCRAVGELNFAFFGRPGTRFVLGYSAFYTARNGIDVFFNGQQQEGSPQSVTRRSKPAEVLLEAPLLRIGGEPNVISFRSNRPNWGVERVTLTELPEEDQLGPQAERLVASASAMKTAGQLYNAYASLLRAEWLMARMRPPSQGLDGVRTDLAALSSRLERICAEKQRNERFAADAAARAEALEDLRRAFPGDAFSCLPYVIEKVARN
jgi:hypothetical protein